MGEMNSIIYKYSNIYQNIIFLLNECNESDINKIALFSVLLIRNQRQEKLLNKNSTFLRDLVRTSINSSITFFSELERTYEIIDLLYRKDFINVRDGVVTKKDISNEKSELILSNTFKQRLLKCIEETSAISILNEVINYV